MSRKATRNSHYSTQGANSNNFFLSILLIVDEFWEGVPIASSISNQEDDKVMKIFFPKLEENVSFIYISSLVYVRHCDTVL